MIHLDTQLARIRSLVRAYTYVQKVVLTPTPSQGQAAHLSIPPHVRVERFSECDLLRPDAGREGESEGEAICQDGQDEHLGVGVCDVLWSGCERDCDIIHRDTWCFGQHGVAESDSVRRG